MFGFSVLWASFHLPAAERKPNIILIMADDVGWECFGSYGAEDYQTPHLDKLASEGIRFNHCYSTPICTPSRIKIMTGQYNFRNYTHFGYLNPKDKTFGHLLKSAGYKTAIAGKWQLNGIYSKNAGYQDSQRPLQAGFDESCLWQVTKGKTHTNGGGERFWSPPLEHNGTFISAQENAGKYGPDIMSDFVCDFIERHKDAPFFVYYPTVLVHDPFVATPDSIGDLQQTNKSPEDVARKKENFVAMVNYMDKIIGKIVKKVEEVGQIENTIILFTADNGTHKNITSSWKGQQITGGKGTTKDMGTRVPLIAYWKDRAPSGAVLDDMIDFTDFYTTFADAAGIRLNGDDPIDGRSFLPQLRGEKGNPRDWVLLHYQPYWGRFQGKQYVRNPLFKLYRDGRFYKVPQDLKEETNLAKGQLAEEEITAQQMLQKVFEIAPPSPPLHGGKAAQERPTYPEWKNIVDPND